MSDIIDKYGQKDIENQLSPEDLEKAANIGQTLADHGVEHKGKVSKEEMDNLKPTDTPNMKEKSFVKDLEAEREITKNEQDSKQSLVDKYSRETKTMDKEPDKSDDLEPDK